MNTNVFFSKNVAEINPKDPYVDPYSENTSNDDHLQHFKVNVELSKDKLIQLTQSGYFSREAEDINRKAIEMVKDGYPTEGGILLAQAQKLLEYAANRGKQINRKLIVTILHNEACCYQQNWNLERCVNYVQALIYNLNCELKQIQSQKEKGLIFTESINLRNSLAHYYLLFCAINSQLKRNDTALIAARNAHSLYKTNAELMLTLVLKSRMEIDQNALVLIEEISQLQSTASNLVIDDLTNIAAKFFAWWKNKCKFPNYQLRNFVEQYKDFSIGNMMQMELIEEVNQKDVTLLLSMEELLPTVIKVSIGYFTMATELRLLALRKGCSKQGARQLSQFRQSQCYHLVSIILILYYFPFQMLYLRHIMASYKTHYRVNLEQLQLCNLQDVNPQELFQKIMNVQKQEEDMEFKGSTAVHSEKAKSSSRSSYQEVKQSHLSKLESCVRASLKSHQPDTNKELAKLNNYYYMRGQIDNFKEQVTSNQKHKKKRGVLTSKNSVHKTPIKYTPSALSPRRSKCSSKTSKRQSKRGSIEHTMLQKKKISVMQEYFQLNRKNQPRRQRNIRVVKKGYSSKENKDYTGLIKAKSRSPQGHLWKAGNISNRQKETKKMKSPEHGGIRPVKSTSQMKSKLVEARYKKKNAH